MGDGPGLTAAPTTAALATGDGPGLTAAPTTAALATGDGPGLTTAAATAAFLSSGIRGSFCTECVIEFDGARCWLEWYNRLGLALAAKGHGLDRNSDSVGSNDPCRVVDVSPSDVVV